MSDSLLDFRISNDCMTDAEELRRRLDQDGYLFLKRLQNPDKILELRREIMDILYVNGWLVADADPMLGNANVSRRITEGDLGYNEVYFQIQRLESFHRIPHERELLDVVERIIGKKAIPLPGHKGRIYFPKFTEHTTPMHQDFVHYQGSTETLTCWSPVGDCPIELGPLAVLLGSHKVRKVLPHHFSLGAGGLMIQLEEEKRKHPELDRVWVSANFEVGDTLFFPALTVHKALPNVTENRMRVSLDNRYEAIGNRIAEQNLKPHMTDVSPLSWEEIYANWKSDDLKYYWRKVDFQKIPRYWGYIRKGLEEALHLAEKGDKHAVVSLRRLVRNHPESAEAARARAILTKIGALE
jgi:ectoine hydroxylase-related dioxygenase (phytanoyl-CoA dioxygenase family)